MCNYTDEINAINWTSPKQSKTIISQLKIINSHMYPPSPSKMEWFKRILEVICKMKWLAGFSATHTEIIRTIECALMPIEFIVLMQLHVIHNTIYIFTLDMIVIYVTRKRPRISRQFTSCSCSFLQCNMLFSFIHSNIPICLLWPQSSSLIVTARLIFVCVFLSVCVFFLMLTFDFIFLSSHILYTITFQKECNA